jgi:hypothetical protein
MAEYIEREAAIAYIKENQCRQCSDIGFCGSCAVLIALRLLKTVPAADVRPVVRGKWIYDCERTMGDGWTYKQYHCSVCGWQMIGGIHNYCPNCNADMREV